MDKKIYTNGIDSKIKVFEDNIEEGLTISLDDVDALEKDVNNLITVAKLSDEEKESFLKRISDIKSLSVAKDAYDQIALTRRAIPVYTTDMENIRKKLKNQKALRIALASAGLATTIALVGCGITKGSDKAYMKARDIETEAEVPQVIINEPVEEKVEYTEMDVEYKEMADDAVYLMNDSISKGLEVTEGTKEKLSLQYLEYYMLNNMDNLTDEQWANVFQNSTVTATDIMNAKEYFEWIDEKRVTVSTDRSTLLDYSKLFKNEDFNLLNDAEDKLLKVRITSGDEHKKAVSEFKDYILENLGKSENRMKYSERALDTFRAVYFDAFDELTNHAVIDDELEHAINTTITCSLSESELDVQDKTIKSLQSDFEIYLQQKLELRLENGWEYASNNELNPYNDVNEMAKYVAENIDLSLYKELPDYEETLNSMFLTGGAKKSKDDSGVSNGKGGVISKSDMLAHGVDPSDPNAKAKYEAAVIAETREIEEKSKQVTNASGTTVKGTKEDYARGYQDGYYAGNNGLANSPSGNESYNLGYNDGYRLGAQDRAALLNSMQDQSATTFEPVDGPSVITETDPITDDYTGTPQPAPEVPVQPVPEVPVQPVPEVPVQPVPEVPVPPEQVEFVPIDDGANIGETIEYSEQGYTTSMVSNRKDISELQTLKNIYMSYFNSAKEIENDHTKTV